MTAKPFYRLQDYIQEANRHSIRVDGFEITAPSAHKKTALKIEAEFCKLYSFDSIKGHREWFKKDISWANEEYQKVCISTYNHKNEFICMCMDINSIWEKENSLSYLFLNKSSQDRLNIKKRLMKVKNLAAELGASGERIKAKLATRMACDMMAGVM